MSSSPPDDANVPAPPDFQPVSTSPSTPTVPTQPHSNQPVTTELGSFGAAANRPRVKLSKNAECRLRAAKRQPVEKEERRKPSRDKARKTSSPPKHPLRLLTPSADPGSWRANRGKAIARVALCSNASYVVFKAVRLGTLNRPKRQKPTQSIAWLFLNPVVGSEPEKTRSTTNGYRGRSAQACCETPARRSRSAFAYDKKKRYRIAENGIGFVWRRVARRMLGLASPARLSELGGERRVSTRCFLIPTITCNRI